MSSYILGEIATRLGAALHGDSNCVITGMMSLKAAGPGQLSFLDNPRYCPQLRTTGASAVLLRAEHLNHCPTNALLLDNPYAGFAKAAQLFQPRPQVTPGVHATALIGADCKIHPSASVGPYVVIGVGSLLEEEVVVEAGCVLRERVQIGAHSQLKPNVTLYDDTQIGRHVLIHSGAVIGGDGFGFARDGEQWIKIPQLGKVRIDHRVEIGANTTIDRGTLNDTVIEEGVLLDNQIQIAHNVHIGKNTAIAGGTCIAGSVRIGPNCRIGGGVCISGHLEIAAGVTIAGMSGVDRSIQKPGIYASGLVVQPHRRWQKNVARFNQLDEFIRQHQTHNDS